MACQSMDDDEILNVRWATEDPNPVQKVAEKRRLEDMGQEAIRARMDPRIVDAMRSVRALEDGDVLDEGGDLQEMDDEQEADGHDTKRRRIENDTPQESQEQPPPRATGLLSADTLEGLRYFAQIRQQNGGTPPVMKRAAPPPPPSGLGLADYGSDED